MKKLLFSLLFVALATIGNAATYSYSSGSGSNNVVFTNATLIRSITVANGTGGNVTNRWYDAGTNSLTWTNASISYSTVFVSNKVDTITNFAGVVQLTTNTYQFTVSASSGGSTNSFPLITTYIVAANTTATWEPSSTLILNRGLMVTNNAAVTLSVDYSTIIP